MSVLVDSTIWSLRFRRPETGHPLSRLLGNLIVERQARIIGPVRQELLTGIRGHHEFLQVHALLGSFRDYRLASVHFETAAEMANLCQSRGLQGAPTDFLLCAVAIREGMSLFTTDKDFNGFAKHLPLRLFRNV